MEKRYYEFNENKFKTTYTEYELFANIYYPCKVNCERTLIDFINSNNGNFEVDSISMIRYLIEDCKVSPDKILYNYLRRNPSNIRYAVSYGLKLFAVDSLDSIKEIELIDQNAQFIVRISIKSLLNLEKSTCLIFDKWGTSIENANTLVEFIRTKKTTKFVGFSFYFPQEYNTLNNIEIALSRILENFKYFEGYFIDIGGGISAANLKKISDKHPEISGRLIVEPGRHLVGDCFDMLCEIVGIHNDIDGNCYVFLNVGIYSGFIDVIVKNHRFDIQPEEMSNSNKKQYVVCGCTSDISDQFGIYTFPENTVKVGALFRIKNCGAYCMQMHMEFAGHDKCEIKNI